MKGELEGKDPLENSFKIQKKRRKENIVWDPETTTREYTWIQRDSNFTSL